VSSAGPASQPLAGGREKLQAVVRVPGEGQLIAGPWGRSYLLRARGDDTLGCPF